MVDLLVRTAVRSSWPSCGLRVACVCLLDERDHRLVTPTCDTDV